MRLRRLAAAAAGVALLACGGDDGGEPAPDDYSAELRAEFVTSCVAQGTGQDQCACLYDALEDEIPIERYAEVDAAIRSGDEDIPDDIADLAASCAAAPAG